MTLIVHRDRNQPVDWGAVAVVRLPLQHVMDARQVDVPWIHEPEEGGWLRELHLELDAGGLALLVERRQYPGEFTLHLQCHRDMFFFQEDYAEVRAFLNLDECQVTLLGGQVRWWKRPGRPRRT